MSHPFGDLLTQHIHRKHGLSQARLAEGILQPAIVISQMCQGKRLTGPQARDRVLAIIGWLAGQQVLDSVTEANALLQAAGMAGLAPGNPVEAQLLEQLAAQTSTATVPDRTQSHRPNGIRHNLPLHLTGFIGRTREMAEVTQLLYTTRILTLVGAGGCGKTRLALHVAAGAVEAFVDGVWWIDLAPVTEPALVPNALATVLGVHQRPGESLLTRVGKVLQDKRSMVVLDNCEHLLDACAQLVVTLVQACPQLVILATSREVLAVPGETSYPVPPLTLPHRPGATPDVLMKYDAIRLFVERARAVQPSFALTGQNATVIVEICRQLDGMPLALELAAARVRAITPGQLLLHLDDRFRLLVGGNRTAHPRQQTLYATIDWSYGLLTEAERRVFHRLAVFADGWTLEAAEAVCAGPDMPQRDVVAHLLNLADKSLVVTEAAQGQQRYHMLETVRQFAAEQLQVAGETEITVRQHWDWFLALALKAEPYLTGPQELEWLARLEADHANLKAALDRSLAQHDGEQAAQLATALRWFWDTCGYLRDSYRYFDAVLEHAAQVPVPLHVRALDAAGMAAFRSGNIPLASTLLEEGASLSRTANDAVGLTTALNDLGLIEFYQNHAERAMALFQESLALARTRDDAIASIRAIGNMGILAMVNADGARAEQYFAEGLTMVMQVGSPRLTGIIYTHLGFAALLQGHVANAAPRLVQGLKRHRHVGDKVYSTYALFGLAGVAGALAEPERMARLLGAIDTLQLSVGTPAITPLTMRFAPQIDAARAQLPERIWQTAFADGQSMTLDDAVDYALAWQITAETPAVPRKFKPRNGS